MKVAVGCDELGFELKNYLTDFLRTQTDVPLEVVDFGVYDTNPVDYPDVALKVAEAIAAGECERGILICGTGIGMAITANKVPGVRAAQVSDPYQAERARMSNDAQIMTLGVLTIGREVAKSLVRIWLASEFQGGRSLRKVNKINAIDERYHAVRADEESAPRCSC